MMMTDIVACCPLFITAIILSQRRNRKEHLGPVLTNTSQHQPIQISQHEATATNLAPSSINPACTLDSSGLIMVAYRSQFPTTIKVSQPLSTIIQHQSGVNHCQARLNHYNQSGVNDSKPLMVNNQMMVINHHGTSLFHQIRHHVFISRVRSFGC